MQTDREIYADVLGEHAAAVLNAFTGVNCDACDKPNAIATVRLKYYDTDTYLTSLCAGCLDEAYSDGARDESDIAPYDSIAAPYLPADASLSAVLMDDSLADMADAQGNIEAMDAFAASWDDANKALRMQGYANSSAEHDESDAQDKARITDAWRIRVNASDVQGACDFCDEPATTTIKHGGMRSLSCALCAVTWNR